ncbi:hypothetical protein CVT25_014418 [Psilocybe cyanescens]|uniref:Uncharacterized protein n=1 Tax=Psilocybe cyanescens TaxID=93625 RepID=A0A409WC49_PSICY|nr:hypothetical protein CVT25_014418 [Psilocybe cyanescens]
MSTLVPYTRYRTMLKVFTSRALHRISLFATQHWHHDMNEAIAAGLRVLSEGVHSVQGDYSNYIRFLDAVVLEKGAAEQAPRCAQRDAIAAVYTIMDRGQRERFNITVWYVDRIEKCIFGGGSPIYVPSDDDDMPPLQGAEVFEREETAEAEEGPDRVVSDRGVQWGIRGAVN